jgi:DnaJ family protein C protein 11
MSQRFDIPILLTKSVTPYTSPLAVLLAPVLFLLVKLSLLDPVRRKRKQKKLEKMRRDSAEAVETAKRAAEAANKLMMGAVGRKRVNEETRNGKFKIYLLFSTELCVGLIIVYAYYGNLKNIEDDAMEENPNVIDVTVPLQYLVEDSKLQLYGGSKSKLLGFWDPCVGEDKYLKIRYLFKDALHEVTSYDLDELALPKVNHKIGV